MPEYTYKTTDLEVLVATMQRTSLDFLYRMFAASGIEDFKILVINQTNENSILKSDHPNIRVINSFETGLSKSRNLALKNAIGPICVNLDDDVVVVPGFAINIIQAHNNFKYPIITFETLTTEGKPYWKYPKEATEHNHYVSQKTLSIEITYKVALIRNQNLYFDERFGLGAQFEDAENFVFLMNARKKGLSPYFSPQPLTVHSSLSSSDDVGSDRVLYAKAAIKTYAYGNFSYLWVLKFVFFIFRKRYIPFVDIPRKLKIGFKSIADYKKNETE